MHKERFFTLSITLIILFSLLFGAGSLDAKAQAGIEANIPKLLGQIGGGAYAITFEPYTYRAYLGIGPRLFIFDVQTPASPILIGYTEPLPDIIQAVSIVGDYAYLTAGESGLFIVDMRDETAPVLMSAYDAPGVARNVDDLAGPRVEYRADQPV